MLPRTSGASRGGGGATAHWAAKADLLDAPPAVAHLLPRLHDAARPELRGLRALEVVGRVLGVEAPDGGVSLPRPEPN